MIGFITGDIIASPYVHNPRNSASDIFFNLFERSSKVSVVMGRNGRPQAREQSYEARPGSLSAAALVMAVWARNGATNDLQAAFDEAGVTVGQQEFVPLCALAGEAARRSGESVPADGVVMNVAKACGMGDASLFSGMTALGYAAYGVNPDSADYRKGLVDKDVVPQAIYSSPSLFEGLVSGAKAYSGGAVVDGDGKIHDEYLLDASLAILKQSGSCEEALRRAVALGGRYGSVLASLTGVFAEQRWGVEEAMAYRVEEYFSDAQKESVHRFDRRTFVQAPKKVAGPREYEMLVMPKVSIYGIPKDDAVAMKAVRDAMKRSQKAVLVVEPADLDKLSAVLAEQRDATGRLLTGTFVESDAPYRQTLWIENGLFASSSTRTFTDTEIAEAEAEGRYLPNGLKRQQIFSEWKGFVEFCRDVRAKLGESVGWEGPGFLRFATGTYPDVPSKGTPRVIRIIQDGRCRGAVGLDREGRPVSMPNYLEKGAGGEYIEGVYAERDVFERKNAAGENIGMKTISQFRDVVEQECLDSGFGIVDEESRQALNGGGEDRDQVLLSPFNRPNSERIYADVSSGPDLPVAVAQDIHEVLESCGITPTAESSPRLAEASEVRKGASLSKVYPGSLFTVGCSNMETDDFLRLLKAYGIGEVLDIRTWTKSSYAPQFEGSAIESALADNGISYQYFGDVFGSVQRDGDKKDLTFDEIRHLASFKDNIAAVREAVKDGARIAVMAAESDPSRSHRFALVGLEMAHPLDARRKSVDVRHILRNGTLLSQEQLESRMLKSYFPNVPTPGPEEVREAYARVGESIRTKKDQKIRIVKDYGHKRTNHK